MSEIRADPACARAWALAVRVDSIRKEIIERTAPVDGARFLFVGDQPRDPVVGACDSELASVRLVCPSAEAMRCVLAAVQGSGFERERRRSEPPTSVHRRSGFSLVVCHGLPVLHGERPNVQGLWDRRGSIPGRGFSFPVASFADELLYRLLRVYEALLFRGEAARELAHAHATLALSAADIDWTAFAALRAAEALDRIASGVLSMIVASFGCSAECSHPLGDWTADPKSGPALARLLTTPAPGRLRRLTAYLRLAPVIRARDLVQLSFTPSHV